MRWAALWILPLLIQDPADKVKALIEKLGSDEIVDREAAQVDLIKLGPAALAAVKEHLERAEGETKSRLQTILARIERDIKVSKLLEPGRLVTLKAKNRPAADVFAELTKQAGFPVEAREIPADTVVSLDAKDLPPAAAIDELCRAHGKLMYAWGRDRVVIFSAPYRRVPSFDRGPYRLIIDGVYVSFTGKPATTAQIMFNAGVVGPPDRLPKSMGLVFERVEDDKGVNRLESPSAESPFVYSEYPAAPRNGPVTFRGLGGNCPVNLPVEASKVACRGYASLRFAVEIRNLASVKAPEIGSKSEGEGDSIEIRRWERNGRRIRAGILRNDFKRVAGPEVASLAVPGFYVLRDAKGWSVEGAVLCSYPWGKRVARGLQSRDESVEFILPEGFEPGELVLGRIEETEEVRIPFDYSEMLR